MRNYFGRLAALCFGAALCAATTGSAQIYSAVHVFSSAGSIQAPLTPGPDGTLYGVSSGGGGAGKGTVFKVQPDGTGFGTIYSFTNGSDGSGPVAGLVLSGNTLYGTAETGGSGGHGTVFKVNTDGSGFATLFSFSAFASGISSSNGANPQASLVLAGGTLYGTTSAGGGYVGVGTVFRLNTNGTGFTNLHSFTNGMDGMSPMGGLVLSGSTLYGTTEGGGSNPSDSGAVFKIDTNGTGFAILHSFSATVTGTNSGAHPVASLALAGGTLYGTASGGGSWGHGTVFRVNSDGTGFTNLYSFTGGTNGDKPMGGLVLSGGTLYGTTYQGGSWHVGTVFRVNTDGSGFTNLYNFGSSPVDGQEPMGGLVLSGGTLYGTTYQGGVSPGYGTVFKLNADGTGYTNLYSFRGYGSTDGEAPEAGLVLSGSRLYGTTAGGTVFEVSTNGTGFAVIANGSEGAKPQAGLLLSGSTFYGTAAAGGLSGNGTVFRVNTNGTSFATLYAFTASTYDPVSGGYTNGDGSTPRGSLVLSGSTLYGTASGGGGADAGTIFKINTDGTGFATLCAFTAATYDPVSRGYTNADGARPYASLLLAGDTLYGTASAGGGGHSGTVFQINTNGTGFALVHTFSAGTSDNIYTNADGAFPSASLLLAGDTLYGTTYEGGPLGGGTLFKVNTNGTGFTNFYNFIATPNGANTSPDGAYLAGRLILSGNTLYGTASGGGIGVAKTGFTCGTLFKVNTDGTGFVRLHAFTEGYDGAKPAAGLTLSGSTLYGTAAGVQIPDKGTLFQVSTDGLSFTTLHTFDFQGGTPAGDLVLVGNTLYGTSEYSAVGSGSGTVFGVTSVPYLQFTASPTNGTPPKTVQFHAPGVDDQGNPILSWNWDFGDGSTDTAQNPSHTYVAYGTFTPSLVATNNNGATVVGFGPYIVLAFPSSILNGGFETGNFTNWTGSGNLAGRFVLTGSTLAHSGKYGAALGASGSLGFLSQTIPTTAGAVYLISFWLNSANSTTTNEFLVSWNGNVLLDETNLTSRIGWTNIQFVVTATAGSAILQFGYRNYSSYFYFGLDDISVVTAQPDIARISLSGTNLVLNGIGGASGRTYYLLMGTNITQPLSQWAPVATNVPGLDGNFRITATNAVNPKAPQRFYILRLQ